MKVLGIICNKCNVFVFSRAKHDCRFCECENCMIDGGVNESYMRYTSNEFGKLSWAEIKQTKETLYKDWNSGKDKYGIIPLNKVKLTVAPHLDNTDVKSLLNNNKKGGEEK